MSYRAGNYHITRSRDAPEQPDIMLKAQQQQEHHYCCNVSGINNIDIDVVEWTTCSIVVVGICDESAIAQAKL